MIGSAAGSFWLLVLTSSSDAKSALSLFGIVCRAVGTGFGRGQLLLPLPDFGHIRRSKTCSIKRPWITKYPRIVGSSSGTFWHCAQGYINRGQGATQPLRALPHPPILARKTFWITTRSLTPAGLSYLPTALRLALCFVCVEDLFCWFLIPFPWFWHLHMAVSTRYGIKCGLE